MKREVIETEDGSKTIFIAEMDENYHSGHGALQEAMHVFIKNGLIHFKENKEINVFEVGFGTGLNALLTMVEADNNNQTIRYTGIEAFPVEMELIDQLGYEDLTGQQFKKPFFKMHTSQWDELQQLTDHFTFKKILSKIQDFEPEKSTVDIVYFDAFGPQVQGEMWSLDILEKMYTLLKPGGILVTYCAKGQFKRDLKSLGFEVEGLPGPPGKREMTRALK